MSENTSNTTATLEAPCDPTSKAKKPAKPRDRKAEKAKREAKAAEKVRQEQELEKQRQVQFIAVTYDIPSTSDIPNPSYRLRRYAFRFNKSCWIMPANRRPDELIAELIEAKANVRVGRWDTGQEAEIRQWAKQEIEQETMRAHTSMLTQINKAHEAFQQAEANLAEAADTASRQEITLAREHSCRVALKRAEQLLNDSLECANVFDQTMELEDAFKGLRNAIASQQASFNVAVEARETLFPSSGKGRTSGEPTQSSRIEACLNGEPKTVDAIVEESGCERARVTTHLKFLVERNRAMKGETGYQGVQKAS